MEIYLWDDFDDLKENMTCITFISDHVLTLAEAEAKSYSNLSAVYNGLQCTKARETFQ